MHTPTRLHAHAYTHMHIHPPTNTHTCTHARAHTYTQSNTHTDTHTYTQKHINTHTQIPILSHAHTHTADDSASTFFQAPAISITKCDACYLQSFSRRAAQNLTVVGSSSYELASAVGEVWREILLGK